MQVPKESLTLPTSVRIIGCGFRCFYSQRSGLAFPAYLIQFSYNIDEDVYCIYKWRAKRDFLLLKRSANHNSNKGSMAFPKNAYSNLCEQATMKPWLRPMIGDLRTEGKLIVGKLGLNDVNLESIQLEEGWGYVPRMKLSIIRLDDFLSQDFASEAWALFCREGDSEGIVAGQAASFEKTNGSQREADDIRRAGKLGQYFASAENAKKVRCVEY